jgi:hypothetical protein
LVDAKRFDDRCAVLIIQLIVPRDPFDIDRRWLDVLVLACKIAEPERDGPLLVIDTSGCWAGGRARSVFAMEITGGRYYQEASPIP